MSSQSEKPPFGGVMAAIGAFVGYGYIGHMFDDQFAGLIGGLIGAGLGYVAEHIIYRLIIIALLVVMFIGRQVFFDAIFNNAEYDTSPEHDIDMAVLVLDTFVPAARAEEEKDITLSEHISSEILHATAHTSLTKEEKLVTKRCESINQYLQKKPGEPVYDALHYSCNGDINVGIALYYGPDFGKHTPDSVSAYFKGEFDKQDMTSKVFIKEHEHGSTITFFIDGDTFSHRPMNPAKAAPPEFIAGVAAESFLTHVFDNGAAVVAAPSQFRDWSTAALKSRETMENWYR